MQDLLLSGENTFLFAIKIGIWLFLLVYVLFAAIVIKQIKIMTETLSTGFEMQLKTLGYLHFASAVVVFVLAIIIL